MGDDRNQIRGQLDFTQFHPLDHWVGTRLCRSYHGGAIQHLRLKWWYQWSEPLLWLPHRMFMCPFGRHEILIGGRETYSAYCQFCRFERPATVEESDRILRVERALNRIEAIRQERRKRDEVA